MTFLYQQKPKSRCSQSFSNIQQILPWQLISLANLVRENYISKNMFGSVRIHSSLTGFFEGGLSYTN